MADKDLRELERKAALGDPQAELQLVRARERLDPESALVARTINVEIPPPEPSRVLAFFDGVLERFGSTESAVVGDGDDHMCDHCDWIHSSRTSSAEDLKDGLVVRLRESGKSDYPTREPWGNWRVRLSVKGKALWVEQVLEQFRDTVHRPNKS